MNFKKTTSVLGPIIAPIILSGCALWPFSSTEEVRSVSDVNVTLSSQEAMGLTQEKLDDSFLKKLSDYLTRQFNNSMTKLNQSHDENEPPWEIRSTYSRYIQSNTGKLAVVQIVAGQDTQQMNAVYVAGLDREKLQRISCVSKISTTLIAISTQEGVCGEKINAVFNQSIMPVTAEPAVESPSTTPWWQFW